MANRTKDSKKIKAVEYKGGRCQRCSYNNSLRALSFHHINPNEKSFDISGAHGRNWETIKTELDKCILLCANCHMELHDNLWNIEEDVQRL